MSEMKYGWHGEDFSAAHNAPRKDNPDDKTRTAPASGKPVVWTDLRNVVVGEDKRPSRTALASKA